MLIPQVKQLQDSYPNNTFAIQMDNVAYHKTNKIKDLLKQHDIKALFQPAYSPDLNPIEHSWFYLKQGIRKLSYIPKTFDQKLDMYLNLNSIG
jgi:transposase